MSSMRRSPLIRALRLHGAGIVGCALMAGGAWVFVYRCDAALHYASATLAILVGWLAMVWASTQLSTNAGIEAVRAARRARADRAWNEAKERRPLH